MGTKIFKLFKFYSILILTLTLNCSSTQSDSRITKFEKVLGHKQTEALNLLVSDFENNLGNIYPDLPIEKGYRKYLKDLLSESTTDWGKFDFQSEKSHIVFKESGLWDEVYIVNYVHEINSQDSIKSMNVNQVGTYMQALYAIKDSDSLVKKYWDKREAAGLMQNELVVNGILNSKPDFNDYFHKRIVVVEFSF